MWFHRMCVGKLAEGQTASNPEDAERQEIEQRSPEETMLSTRID